MGISRYPDQTGPAGHARPAGAASTEQSGESDAERSDRDLGELLQELRVAGVGVQVLFGLGCVFALFWLLLPLSRRQRGSPSSFR